MDTWILRKCRASCIHQLLAWVLVVIVFVMICALNSRYVYNFCFGPFPISEAELESIGDSSAAEHFFVRVTGSRTFDTGIRQITIRNRNGVEVSRSTSAQYYGLLVGEKILIVKSDAGQPTVVEGGLAPMPSDLSYRLFNDPDFKQVQGLVLPCFLDTGWSRAGGYVGITIGLGILVAYVMKGRKAWRYLQDPSLHPVVRRVAAWGDPAVVSAEIEGEDRSGSFKRAGHWRRTEHYLISKSWFGFDVLRARDLIWAYNRVTKHSVNFIPTGKTYETVFHCYGGTATLSGSETDVDAYLRYAVERAPWAFFGFSAAIQALFSKDVNGAIRTVEERRREFMRLAAAKAVRPVSEA